MFRIERLVADHRGIEIGIGHLDQALQFGQFAIAQVGYLVIRKPPENEVHFTGAAMPAAEQKPLAAVIEAIA